MNAKERMYSRIKKYGKDLIAVFNLPSDTDAIKLCKRLHRLEIVANRNMTYYANGDIGDAAIDFVRETITAKLSKIIGAKNMSQVFINGDPRGYSLKFKDAATQLAHERGISLYRDFGGYGILAPEFNGDK